MSRGHTSLVLIRVRCPGSERERDRERASKRERAERSLINLTSGDSFRLLSPLLSVALTIYEGTQTHGSSLSSVLSSRGRQESTLCHLLLMREEPSAAMASASVNGRTRVPGAPSVQNCLRWDTGAAGFGIKRAGMTSHRGIAQSCGISHWQAGKHSNVQFWCRPWPWPSPPHPGVRGSVTFCFMVCEGL